MQRAVETAASAPSVLPVAGSGLVVQRDGRTILGGVDIAIGREAGTTVLLGPNGAGKSLLVRVLAGLVEPDLGTVTWGEMPVARSKAARIGFVFQRPVLLRRSAIANIEYALEVSGAAASERTERAAAALSKAGLSHLAETHAHVLSGGEQQRLALARALAMEPGLYILDEPTANLDPASTAAIEKVLRAIREAGVPVLLITHDLGQARRLADDVIFLHHGRILERTPAQDFFEKPKSAEAQSFIKGEIVL